MSTGVEPPAFGWIIAGAIVVPSDAPYADPPSVYPGTIPDGLFDDAVAVAATAWVCGATLAAVRVTLSVPPTWPMTFGDSPGPVPSCIGARPRRSGSANVVWPLPP